MLAEQITAIARFAEAVSKLKRAQDRRDGVTLTVAEVDGLIWGIKTLREGSEDAAASDPA